MSLDVATLLSFQPDRDEAEQALRTAIASAPYPIPLETLDTPGTYESAIVFAVATLEGNRSVDRLTWVKEGYRSTASRTGVALIADQFFALPVRSADFATSLVVITNSKGGLFGPFEPGELRFLNHGTDPVTVYENTEPVTISPAPSLMVPWVSSPIGVRAIDPGTASNAAVGDIDALETALDGVTVTNTQAAIGQDDEDATSINKRIDAQIGLFGVEATGESTGTPATAIEAIALSGEDRGGGCVRADGTRVTVTRTKVVRDDAAGTATLYVADADGPLDAGDLTIVTDEVQAYGERVCLEVIVENASPVAVSIVATLTIADTQLTDDDIGAIIDEQIEAMNSGGRIGGFNGTVPKEFIEGALRSSRWTTVNVAMSSPASAVALADNEVAVFALTSLTITRIS